MLKLLAKNAIMVFSILFILSMARLYFFIKTSNLYSDYQTDLALLAFLHGLRFDLSVLMYANFLFFALVCFERIRNNKAFHLFFAFLNSAVLALSLADVEFYLAYGKKLSPSFFSKVKGTGFETLFSMSFQYGFVFLFLLINMFIFYKLTTYLYQKDQKIRFYPVYFLACLGLGLLGVRGGFQKRVLGKTHIHLYAGGKTWASDLTSNTVHNLIRNRHQNAFPKAYLKKQKAMKTVPRAKLEALGLNKTPKNIVIIMVESMSSYVVEKEGLLKFDFMTEDSNSVLSISDTYANGKHSIDALMASFFGIPSYFNLDIIESKYLGNKWIGMPTVLKEHGFKSVFLHAARGGTQFFDSATNIAGFDEYRSVLDEFKVPKDMKGMWGVHDDFLYDKSVEALDEYKSPFLATVFTTSTHVPFIGTPLNPDSLGSKEQDYFAAARYASQSLERFFKKAKAKEWYEDSLFVIMADHNPPIHNQWSKSEEFESKIPMIFYLPGSNMAELKIKKVSQQIDLPLSIFQILNIEPKVWSPYGSSVFDLKSKSPVFYTGDSGRELSLISKDGLRKTKTIEGSAKSSGFLEVEDLIHDYIHRLENDKVYSR